MTYYAVVNDLIGGYDVSKFNKSVGEHGRDEPTLAWGMSKENAEMVAAALNYWHRSFTHRSKHDQDR